MAKIYSSIDGIKVPEITTEDWISGNWEKKEEQYVSQVREVCKKNAKGSCIGEVIKIPHADSYAYYMVYSLKPLVLIHLPLGDCWHSEFAELLTVKKVVEMVQRERGLKKLFS